MQILWYKFIEINICLFVYFHLFTLNNADRRCNWKLMSRHWCVLNGGVDYKNISECGFVVFALRLLVRLFFIYFLFSYLSCVTVYFFCKSCFFFLFLDFHPITRHSHFAWLTLTTHILLGRTSPAGNRAIPGALLKNSYLASLNFQKSALAGT